MLPVNQSEHPILSQWLQGTTCSAAYVMRRVLFENETHIVLKHYSHAELHNGFEACRAYAKLYLKSDLSPGKRGINQSLSHGDGELKRWGGKISLKRVLADCEALGIHFNGSEEIKWP